MWLKLYKKLIFKYYNFILHQAIIPFVLAVIILSFEVSHAAEAEDQFCKFEIDIVITPNPELPGECELIMKELEIFIEKVYSDDYSMYKKYPALIAYNILINRSDNFDADYIKKISQNRDDVFPRNIQILLDLVMHFSKKYTVENYVDVYEDNRFYIDGNMHLINFILSKYMKNSELVDILKIARYHSRELERLCARNSLEMCRTGISSHIAELGVEAVLGGPEDWFREINCRPSVILNEKIYIINTCGVQ